MSELNIDSSTALHIFIKCTKNTSYISIKLLKHSLKQLQLNSLIIVDYFNTIISTITTTTTFDICLTTFFTEITPGSVSSPNQNLSGRFL